jgi:hypothetical protein
MKIFLPILLICLLIGAGCVLMKNNSKDNRQVPNLPAEKLEMTEKKQDAVFFIAHEWTGGYGSAPIIDLNTSLAKRYNDKPIYLQESKVAEVKEKGNLPDCIIGKPAIVVIGQIHLEPRNADGDVAKSEKDIDYYEAILDDLSKVEVYAEKCEE